MKITVDYDLCESNAVCMGLVPTVFEVRDDDFLYVLDENPPQEVWEAVRLAVKSCPRQAISITE